MTTTARIRIRRDTAAAFTSANPTLALGEIAFERDTKRFKVGDGATAWTSLGYAAESPVNLTVQGTGAITIPSGTIAQRPGTPTAGMIRYNSDKATPEWYSSVDTAWIPFGDDVFEVEYLVVAGGAGGGAGGGGAGGFRTNVGGTGLRIRATQSYTVTVGAGGAGGLATGGSPVDGANGSASVFSTISSAGGGGGGSNVDDLFGNAGGSGGGACYSGASGNRLGGAGNTPSVSPSQGNNGGDSNGSNFGGGGGGGAGAVGANNSGGNGGNGGNGTANSISGSSVTYAGGGGGGSLFTGTPGNGGTGGGGNGNNIAGSGSNGSVNLGGGGGGTGQNQTGGNGGSGIVIIRYPGAQRASGGDTVATSGGYTIHTFTTSGTFALVA